MSHTYELSAEKRDVQGTGASRRLRRAGKIPAVIYGGHKDPEMVNFDHDTIYHLLEQEAFHTSILKLKVGSDEQQAILRDVQMHPYRQLILHMDLQRVSASEKIHMSVPLHFLGETTAPGVKLQGGVVFHLLTEVDVSCLPRDLPEYLEADISALNLGETLHLSSLKLPEGVELTIFAHGGDDLGVATISAVRGGAKDEDESAEGEAAEGEGSE